MSEKIDKSNSRIDELSEKIDKSNKKIDETNNKLESVVNDVREIKVVLDNNSKKLEEHDKRFEGLEIKMDKMFKNLEDLSKIEKLHFEYTSNKFNRIEQKVDSNFRYVDEKIDNTKNKLVSEATEVLESFSIAATKSIKNIESKIDNEKNERALQIDQIKGMNDYNKIILRNLESRICILEEESEKYNSN